MNSCCYNCSTLTPGYSKCGPQTNSIYNHWGLLHTNAAPQAPPQALDQSSPFKKDSPSDLSFNVRSISGWELLVWITPSLNATQPSDALKQFVLHTHFISPQQNSIFLLNRACLNPLKLCWYVKPSMLKSVTFKPSDAESVTAGYMCVCTCVHWGFPDGSDRKQSACNAGDLGLNPGSGRSPGEENCYPLQIARRNITNLRYADDTTLMAGSNKELKSLLMKMKQESEKAGLKLNIQKMKIMESSSITSWQLRWGHNGNTDRLFSWAPKSLRMVTAAMKLEGTCSSGEELWRT